MQCSVQNVRCSWWPLLCGCWWLALAHFANGSHYYRKRNVASISYEAILNSRGRSQRLARVVLCLQICAHLIYNNTILYFKQHFCHQLWTNFNCFFFFSIFHRMADFLSINRLNNHNYNGRKTKASSIRIHVVVEWQPWTNQTREPRH